MLISLDAYNHPGINVEAEISGKASVGNNPLQEGAKRCFCFAQQRLSQLHFGVPNAGVRRKLAGYSPLRV